MQRLFVKIPLLLTVVLLTALPARAWFDPHMQLSRDADGNLQGHFSYRFLVGTYYEWNTDPTAIPGLLDEYARRTGLEGEIEFLTVSLADPAIGTNPLLIMTGNRRFYLADEEIANLRTYLKSGGFLYADDCGGADQSFRRMLGQVLDGVELVPLPLDHPMFHSFYNMPELPKIIDLYGGSATAYGGYIGGRLAVIYTYDTDIPCGWEKHPDGSFVHILSPGKHEGAIRFGVNVLHFVLRQLAGQQEEPTDEMP